MHMPEKLTTYDESAVRSRLESELPGWYLEDGWIRRQYRTDGWQSTIMLVDAIAYVAEAAYHHPDLSVTWAKVWVKLKTHSAGGITDRDFELARRIEEVVLWRPQGGALEGTPNKFVFGGKTGA
jgi:4a-hydroxytetrahydrobiopterin dehydratase